MAMYIGQKVVYQELLSHRYAHVDIIDGERLFISEGGELRIAEGQGWSPALGKVVRKHSTPARWNFVYENKNPGLEPAAYHAGDRRLPELFDNIEGDFHESS
jgi:hypothetical protein